ncbi:hypothetical protein C8R46DRAFT_310674 [Mycena filopes]|nr:hypothetical protein C8R46DRAFT_310674 [Mycena filopes]
MRNRLILRLARTRKKVVPFSLRPERQIQLSRKESSTALTRRCDPAAEFPRQRFNPLLLTITTVKTKDREVQTSQENIPLRRTSMGEASKEMRPPFEEDDPTRDTETIPHPMLTLPPEIIAEIFANFLPPYPERPPLAGLFSPLMLCRICRYWRQVAITTPTLWRAIQIDLRDWDSDKGRAWRLYLLNAWLRRSGDCSLSICIHHIRGYIPRATIPEFYHTVARHRLQLQHLDLVLSFGNLPLVQGDMPHLRHLMIGPNELLDSSKP